MGIPISTEVSLLWGSPFLQRSQYYEDPHFYRGLSIMGIPISTEVSVLWESISVLWDSHFYGLRIMGIRLSIMGIPISKVSVLWDPHFYRGLSIMGIPISTEVSVLWGPPFLQRSYYGDAHFYRGLSIIMSDPDVSKTLILMLLY